MPQSAASNAGERQADPERQAEGRRQQRVGIGADRIEGDVAEIEQAGEADHDVEPPAQHHVDQDLDAVVVDPFERRRPEPRISSKRERVRGTARRGRSRRHALGDSGAPRRRASGALTTRRCGSTFGEVQRGEAGRKDASEGEDRQPATAAAIRIGARACHVGVGVQEHDRHEQSRTASDGRDRPRLRGARRTPTVSVVMATVGHASNLLDFGRPSRPDGMKMSVMARIENAATSL